MPQERIPQQEQDLDPGRQKNPLEDFNLDTFLSSAPETRHAWQEDFERSMAQGPGKEEGQAAATQGDATSYADGERFHVVPGPNERGYGAVA